jgi:hypothetical protein
LAAAKAASSEELFAAARRDDRGTYSAALFSLEGGDVRAVELPERGHDIALRPGSGEWVAFARRPGRFGVAVPTDGRQPIWFHAKPTGISSAMASTRPTASCSTPPRTTIRTRKA